MKKMHDRALIGAIAGLLVWLAGQSLAAEPARQSACEMHRTITVTMKYLIYLPKDYQQKPSWPLLLFLHGIGERGNDVALVKKHGPPKLIEAGQDFPFIVVSPQCPPDQWWEPLEIKTLLDEIGQNYKVDKDRVYLTGLSMGGFGAWALATYQPNRFAALVPVCGGGEPIAAKALAHIPVWAFHGGKDAVVPLARSAQMVEVLKKNKGDAKLTVYPDAGHDAWTQTYANPEVYQWLLEQKRTARPAERKPANKNPAEKKPADKKPAESSK